ncbi:MAG: DUF711 family protein [Anaerolineaceae bacterium]|nr:DUF711 family protein [Anaerolineaceae bacterium]
MRIRSITCFMHPQTQNTLAGLTEMADLAHTATDAFQQAGFEVQTTRLATTPFPQHLPSKTVQAAREFARRMESAAVAAEFDFLSLGPAAPDDLASYALIPEMLKVTENTFFSGIMARRPGGLDLAAVRACAEVVAASADITPDGFANLRFTALGNVPAFTPFFPAAYHQGSQPAFALALEAADVVDQAFRRAGSVREARQRLVTALDAYARDLTRVAYRLADQFQVDFKGMDFSPAPFPEERCSLGGAIELLGAHIGRHGALAAAAILADALDQGHWLRAGFNGLMLPVLEDAILARRAAEGSLTIKDLLLYSTVCGTGLDTVPLPGDATAEQIYPVLLDIAALSLRLDKPLTARLMPIPGKQAGDATEFDFAYFENGGVLALPDAGVDGLLAAKETFDLNPRHSYR